MGLALRHRYVMVHYAGFAALVCVLVYGLSLMQGPTDIIVSSLVLGLVALQMVMTACLRVAAALRRWLGWQGRLWVTPALLVGMLAMQGTVETTQAVMGMATDWSHVWPAWIAGCGMAQVAMAGILRGPLPRALAAIRAAGDGIGTAEASLRGLMEQAAAEPVPAPLMAGAVRVPLAQVRRLEANGNYVLVVTADGRHLAPGPFGAVAAALPERLGRRVHRSHWVATGAVQRLVKAGRNLWIVAADEAVVPVAPSMQQAVQDWLAERGILPERGARPRAAKAGR